MAEVKENIEIGMYETRPSSKTRSRVWQKFLEIFHDDKQIENLFFCKECKEVVHNPANSGNTNALLRHGCTITTETGAKRHLISESSKGNMLSAAVKLICNNLRPYSAIEDSGILMICYAAMKFGQNHKHATIEDLKELLPKRNTVKYAVQKKANENKTKIRELIKKAIEVIII